MNKSEDLEFNWFTKKYGTGWETWRELASTWVHSKEYGVDHSRVAVSRFLEEYLVPQFISDPIELFQSVTEPYSEFLARLDLSEAYAVRQNNEAHSFIDWLIITYYTEPDDNGDPVPLFQNPLNKASNPAQRQETVYNALPYAYIKRLRKIICPNSRGHFSDWEWAVSCSEAVVSNTRHFRDWILVDPEVINKDDPDCVWQVVSPDKEKTYRINGVLRTCKPGENLYMIWSPVRAMALYLKLELPLRTFQVRMLDSGEADTWRYEAGSWQMNTVHDFAEGTEQRPWQKGVFHRIRTPDIGDVMTGLYINTNKTADRNKDELTRGYVIPWQHEQVLYWLEKLRNWQEKYNPITEPTSIHELEYRHFGAIKTPTQRDEIGNICFLFRNASSSIISERTKPITSGIISSMWALLLAHFEYLLYEEGTTLSDGRRIRFVDGKNPRKALFPLHSLRVSLITCYALEGEIPAPVLSKLLVGHSRLIMTMHYTKITPAVMAQKMMQAEDKIDHNEAVSLKTFLADQSMEQIELQTACRDIQSINTVLRVRNPAGWQERAIGLCMVGGNTSANEGPSSPAGCWNGGDILAKANRNQSSLYGPVPHGFENCIRCRWFITDIRYLNALTAHFNNLSYQITESSRLASELTAEQDALMDEKYFCEVNHRPFTKGAELQALDRRIEKQQIDADEYCKDLIACFQVIRKLVSLEESRSEGEKQQKWVALGSPQDIATHFSFFETDSELRQLIQLCQDAEIYPDFKDEIRQSPVISRRSEYLNRALMQSGYMPVFLPMDAETQLLAGNAMVRAMESETDNSDSVAARNGVANYLDAQEFLIDTGLLDKGIKAIEQETKRPVLKLSDLTSIKSSKGIGYE